MKSIKKLGIIIITLITMFGITGCFELVNTYTLSLSTEFYFYSDLEVNIFPGSLTLADILTESVANWEDYTSSTIPTELNFNFEEGVEYTVLCYDDNNWNTFFDSGDDYVIIYVYLVSDDFYEIPDDSWTEY